MSDEKYHAWLHRYSAFVAFCTFCLVIAGALVTGNDAGLSVASWPTSSPGQQGLSTIGIFHMPRMAGGIKFDQGHRLIAGAVGILMILLVAWMWRQDSRRWLRWVGIAAVAALLAQAVLGGASVLANLPVAISSAHAALGQIFFCLAASLFFFTAPGWRWQEDKLRDTAAPSFRRLTAVTTGIMLLQLILGSVYRHSHDAAITLHVAGACVVTILACWIVAIVLMRYSRQPALLRPALLLTALVIAQSFLGVSSFFMAMAARNAPQPLPPVVDVTTAHVAVGALILVTSLYLTYQAHRFVGNPGHEMGIASAPHQATA